jgi:hypothetical protein
MMSREVLILPASAYAAAADRLLGSLPEQQKYCRNFDRPRSSTQAGHPMPTSELPTILLVHPLTSDPQDIVRC